MFALYDARGAALQGRRPGKIFRCEESPWGAPEHLVPLGEPYADDCVTPERGATAWTRGSFPVGGPRWGEPRNISFRWGEPDADDSAECPREERGPGASRVRLRHLSADLSAEALA